MDTVSSGSGSQDNGRRVRENLKIQDRLSIMLMISHFSDGI